MWGGGGRKKPTSVSDGWIMAVEVPAGRLWPDHALGNFTSFYILSVYTLLHGSPAWPCVVDLVYLGQLPFLG